MHWILNQHFIELGRHEINPFLVSFCAKENIERHDGYVILFFDIVGDIAGAVADNLDHKSITSLVVRT
jgi:hypothetical protein